jgi:steroid 5-alpha reductase family enzyme
MLVPLLETTIPYVRRVEQCADFSKTFQPYLPQLYDLPQQIYKHINDFEGLKHLYLSTNPLIVALAFALALAPVVLIVSEINKNYSQVDRLWSFLPVLYNCHYALWAHLSGIPSLRLDHVMSVSILWGARLTFNYWRKGGYQIGSEDYRWIVVRKYAGPVGMFAFNVAFISLGQSVSSIALFYLLPRN